MAAAAAAFAPAWSYLVAAEGPDARLNLEAAWWAQENKGSGKLETGSAAKAPSRAQGEEEHAAEPPQAEAWAAQVAGSPAEEHGEPHHAGSAQ